MNQMSFKGKIRIVDDDGVVLSEIENMVTEFWEEYVAAGTMDAHFSHSGPWEAGQSFVHSPLYNNTFYNQGYLLTVYLLNLSDVEKSALSKKSHLLPVYNGEYQIDNDKILGYATATYEATQPKQGYMTPLVGTDLSNPRTHGLRFHWDADVISGEFNAVAIGFDIHTNPYNGACIYRGIETQNSLKGDTYSVGYMLRPGVRTEDGSVVITADDEILLGDTTSTTKARKVLNLTTGVETALGSDDPRYDFMLFSAAFQPLVANGKMIYYNSYNFAYDIATGATTQITDRYSSTEYVFTYNGYAYFLSGVDYAAYNLSTMAFESSANLLRDDMNIPEIWLENLSNINYLRITNLGEDKYMLIKSASSNSASLPNNKAVIFTDPTNVGGSIIDVVPFVNSWSAAVVNGENYFFNNYYFHSCLPINRTEYYKNTSGSTATVEKVGVKFTKQGLYGNLCSIALYDAPQTIAAGKGFNLTYAYTFEQ